MMRINAEKVTSNEDLDEPVHSCALILSEWYYTFPHTHGGQ